MIDLVNTFKYKPKASTKVTDNNEPIIIGIFKLSLSIFSNKIAPEMISSVF